MNPIHMVLVGSLALFACDQETQPVEASAAGSSSSSSNWSRLGRAPDPTARKSCCCPPLTSSSSWADSAAGALSKAASRRPRPAALKSIR
jgi:hypothetical protein